MQLPTFLQIEPVGQCNLRCQMCPIQFRLDGPPHGPPAFMPYGLFTRLLSQFPTVTELHLQGLGEPFMHPRLFDMITYAHDRGLRVSTNSNMTVLSARRAEECVRSGLGWLHVSIDGATPETYERIRVRGKFTRLMQNLELLLAARQRLGSRQPHLRLVTVVMRQNLHELPDIVRLAHEWSMEAMFVQHLSHTFGESSLPAQYESMRNFVQAETLLAEDPARVAHYFMEARTVADALGVDLRLPQTQVVTSPPGARRPRRCDWPWTGAYISYQGKAMPCCMVATPDRLHFGDLAISDVATVWNSSAYNHFRTCLASDTPPEICRSCALYAGTF